MTETALQSKRNQLRQWRQRIDQVVNGSETSVARRFDVILIAVILASVVAVMLESIEPVNVRHHILLHTLEWGFTLIFTIEYTLRLYSSPAPLAYARSFYGIVDLMAVLPTYISVLIPGAQALIVVRLLRIMRVFRVLKLASYTTAGEDLVRALRKGGRTIVVFLVAIFALAITLGSLIYLIEGAENGFDSIPRSVYWAIVTLTTVGYGDISPQTPLGQLLAAVIMVLGYAIIVVWAGIISSHLASKKGTSTIFMCVTCGDSTSHTEARYCRRCGTPLQSE